MTESVRTNASSGLRLRESPGDGATRRVLPFGTTLEVLGRDTWLHVRTPSGLEGFVLAQYVEPVPAGPAPAQPAPGTAPREPRLNADGIELIKRFEGLHLRACPAQVWTIGYGHTGAVREGQVIDESEAQQLLLADLAGAEKAVRRHVRVPLDDDQFSALVSFTFNLGEGNLRSSTLLRKLNAGDYDAVPSELARWVKAGGRTLAGLVRRRAAEGELFMRARGGAQGMPQQVESVEGTVSAHAAGGYLTDAAVTLRAGNTDDAGHARYLGRTQDVPDGYVTALQRDLRSLGFTAVGEPDGAFGENTRQSLRAFQALASVPATGEVDEVTRHELARWLEQGRTRSEPEPPAPAPVAGARMLSPRVPHFSQGDPRWAGRTLGRRAGMARQGCAVSSVAMVLAFFGRAVDPGRLDEYLDAHDGYVGDGLKWAVAGRFPDGDAGLRYRRVSGSQDELIVALEERLGEDLPSIVRVDYGSDADNEYNHFVVCVGRTADGGLVMNDPASSAGDGYAAPGPDNVIQRTSRKGGYRIVSLELYDPAS